MMNITKEHAIKVLDLLSHGLVKGIGVQEPGKMCVEAAVCCALGLPHSDNPPCVAPAVRSFKITLNDLKWSSNAARAKGLQRVALAQLGSDGIDQSLFVKELALATIQKIVPLALRSAARVHLEPSHRENLERAAKACESATEAAESTRSAEAAEAAASAAAWSAWSAAKAAAAEAAEAAKAAAAAAEAAAWSAWSAKAAWSAETADEVLSLMAEIGVGALIKCQSPGCQWFPLIKEAA